MSATPATPAPFTASVNGFGFANRWPHVPPLRFRVGGPVPVELAIGDAANGLCGGMAFAALDLWFGGVPMPPGGEPPVDGSPAFRYLVRRQLDSFELGLGPARFYLLGAPWRSAGSRSAEVLRRELPRIRRDLDAGRPVALGLVHTVSANPATLIQDHQVVACAIEAGPDPGSVSLRIYDPNLPGDDAVRLTVGRSPSGMLTVDYSGGPPVVAFFRQGYRPRDPMPLRLPLRLPSRLPSRLTARSPRGFDRFHPEQRYAKEWAHRHSVRADQIAGHTQTRRRTDPSCPEMPQRRP